MQTLLAVQKSFYSIGFSPKLEPFNHKTVGILVIAFSVTISLWIYLLHEADSFQEYMESIYVVTAGTCIFLSFPCTIFIKKELFSFIDSIDELSNERLKNPTSKAICEKSNRLVEKYSEIGVIAVKNVIVPSFIIPKAIYSFFIYFSTDLDDEAFDLPIRMWFPFNWKNPTGYLTAVATEWLCTVYLFRYIGCYIFLAFGVFMFALSFFDDLKRQLSLINKMASHKKSPRDKMYKKLSKFIRWHASARQMLISFSDLYEITLTLLFVGCTIAISVALLLFQIEISHDETDSMILLEAGVFGVWSLILMLFVCELGQRFSNAIDKINDVINHQDWYLFPKRIQRVLPIVMINTQQPAVIKCFGNVLCARKQFRKVVKTVYSYFMLLRKFYK